MAINVATKTDADITADVVAELAWDPAVTVADLDVMTSNGYVTLSGTAATYSIRDAAEDAAYRVFGVRGVNNDIVVVPVALGRTDGDIAADVQTALTLDTLVPLDRVNVAVLDGVVTLTGNLDYYYQREAAEDDAGQIAGVQNVSDLITVIPPDDMAGDVADQIAQAFARHAELADDDVTVTVDGNAVTLGGTVSSWSEYDEAEDAAWRAPGVSTVVNNIAVVY
jgi:osmotically-inducible protein OsmY